MAAHATRTHPEDWLVAVQLFHPIPSLVTAVMTLAFGLLFGMSPLSPRFWLMGVAMLLSQFSISAANDWTDWMHDVVAARTRPVPLGMIEPRAALAIAIACGLAAIAFALLLGPLAGAVAIVGIGAGWTYDLVARTTPFSALPFAVAFPLLPLWVGVIAGRFPRSVPALLVAGIPLAVAIHLADAVPDLESDAARGVRTLAVSLGRGRARVAAAAALLLGALLLAAAGGRWWILGLALIGSALYWQIANKWILIGSAAVTALLWFL